MTRPNSQVVDFNCDIKNIPAAWRDVLAERRRHVEVKGWTLEHDAQHDPGDLAKAAAAYLIYAADCLKPITDLELVMPGPWPWSEEWWKPADARGTLVKAASMILAQIEVLDLADAKVFGAAPISQGIGERTPGAPNETPNG